MEYGMQTGTQGDMVIDSLRKANLKGCCVLFIFVKYFYIFRIYDLPIQYVDPQKIKIPLDLKTGLTDSL